ncbi:cupin domain-containing protein [Elongatibacter sediminis]|uniref:Cupin domain-containing protein n=1 Tax=Elongatibacter sediminis TaxID=3119006 RepID=A0AAW9RA34_9GAMM
MALIVQRTPPLRSLGDMPVDRFLRDYWQSTPCLLRQVFPDFEPELDPQDIAGLACEELAEARLVSGRYPEHDWRLRHGPFGESDLLELPESDWTLLVQDVEKHYPPLTGILEAFGFLPTWRIDDLMSSVAAPGGSVGPHVDQYDVFLLQASGRRRWSISRNFDPERVTGCELDVLQRFDAETHWDLEPGDVLYLPPGVAHHGVALDLCMTWSIGLRAPSQADLLIALGEWLAEHGEEGERYTDPRLGTSPRPGEIDGAARDRFSALLGDAVNGPAISDEFLGRFLSTYRLAHAPAAPDTPLAAPAVASALQTGALLHRNPWTRLAWTPHRGAARLYAAGECIECRTADAERLCAGACWRLEGAADPELTDLVTRLVNRGHLILEMPDATD